VVADLAFVAVFSLGADLALNAGFTVAVALAMDAGLVLVAAVVFTFDGGVLLIDRSVFPDGFRASVAGLLAFDVGFFTSPPSFWEFGTFLLSPKLGVAASNAIPTATVSPRIHLRFMTDEPRYFPNEPRGTDRAGQHSRCTRFPVRKVRTPTSNKDRQNLRSFPPWRWSDDILRVSGRVCAVVSLPSEE
jgi:hypothetical protein